MFLNIYKIDLFIYQQQEEFFFFIIVLSPFICIFAGLAGSIVVANILF
jgi:hypothetical protein